MAGIAFLLLAVAFAPATMAADWYSLVDEVHSTTNGPFQLRDGDEIQIGSNRYQIAQTSPLFGLEKRSVAKVEATNATPEAVLRQAWADAPSRTNQPLPELLFRNISTNSAIWLNLRRVELADLVRYVCEIANLEVSRCRGSHGLGPADVLIVQPHGTHDEYETQIYGMAPARYDQITADGHSFAKFLIKMGILETESDAQVEYRRAEGWIILRAPHETHEGMRRIW